MLIPICLSLIAFSVVTGFLRGRGHGVRSLYWLTVLQPIILAVVSSGLIWIALGDWQTGRPNEGWLRPTLIGLLTGTLVAIGGAAKDTGWEKFSWLKFTRSPLIGVAWGYILHFHGGFGPWWHIVVMIIPCERFTVDDWKVFRGDRPSKFKHPNRDRGWLWTRFRLHRP